MSIKSLDLMKTKKKFNHLMIEIHELRSEFFEREKLFMELRKLIKNLNLEVVESISHKYLPHGLTASFLLSSSHLVAHTWPEHNYLHIDLFCCSALPKTSMIKSLLEKIFLSTKLKIRRIEYV